jgi:hypothetical protein
VVARLALDEADRLEQALRRKYRTPADALAALGIDQNLLEEGERMMMRGRDTRSRDQEEMSEFSPDRGRDWRNRDQGEPGEGEGEETLEELLAKLGEEDRKVVFDAVRALMSNRDWASDRRRMGRDQPEPFPGMPMPGGGMVGGSTNWSDEAADRRYRREADDRKRSRFAHDMAMASGQGFADFFPDAMRIRTTGF